ncbi:2-succinyl-5-enolpyruvyl-6-hydroxy-3-cyclohexene-1-carboxylic-acid synthase [Ruania alkalisoli]|uniref:2-succinyl-5-enolpyruvyl-6-hydroxy-3-cyclohexene-1-carboxylate synthase n=1 Tax=Ruania alkalisoli TaxID=2779775 RepID=A0A7M1STT7_9MICO|nr:2-succinyl-5-enolpyruvyl-6-hydroxy-3-cyclohexene-1-carboxylic-acid synthase [Ruania alkalisoli]QOR70033.1 2-succinyl-5-enolpyruvyl-6-hydroxy-3-cyclohexene-1-carboxylic-acid synthase [Ruania alkalisoli]
MSPSATRARALVTALVASGVRDVVLAPGSRSAPLAYALHAAERAGWLELHVRIDERSAAFVALGIARHRPAAVVTTSGTAVANLYPAVLEAAHSGLPLLAITADRPHELRGVGANQTTDQVKLFGSAVRYFAELPADDDAPGRGIDAVTTRAVLAATGTRTRAPGPAHLNVAFRDPLVPDGEWSPGPVPGPLQVVASSGGAPVELPRGPRTVVVAGDGAARVADPGIVAGWGWPVIAEPSSGLCHVPTAVLAGRIAVEVLGAQVERVVVLGKPTLSRPVGRLLARTDIEVLVASGSADWADVTGTAQQVVDGISPTGPAGAAEQAWVTRWLRASAAAARVLDQPRELDGPAVAAAMLHAGGTVLLGASMAVRDADLVCADAARGTQIVANRGLAGIDGTLSTGAGLALATGRPVRVLVGDLTFQHDLGGLARGPLETEVDLQVIVLNDDGGSIFATLEHGERAETFERIFRTPQGLDLASLATGFGARYTEVVDAERLAGVLASPLSGRSVVEVRLDGATARERNQRLSDSIRAAMAAAADESDGSTAT